MPQRTWRERLKDAVERDGRSLRAISLAAGLSHGYLHSVLESDKEPSITYLERLASVLGVSVGYIMEGYELSPETERLLKVWAALPLEQRQSLLEFLAGRMPPPNHRK